MKTLWVLLAALVFVLPVSAYDTLFADNFNSYDTTKLYFGDTAGYRLVTEGAFEGGCIKLTSGADSNAYIVTSLPLAVFAGKRIEFSAMFRGEKLSPPSGISCINFMICQIDSAGSNSCTAADFGPADTTFGWKRMGRQVSVPRSASQVNLVFLLQKLPGTLYVDDLVVRLLSDFDVPARSPKIPIDKYHDVPMLRGTTVCADPSRPYLHMLGREWKANLLRWWFRVDDSYNGMSGFEAAYAAELNRIDSILPFFAANGLRMVLVYCGHPGGYFSNKEAQDRFVNGWKSAAAHFKDSPEVWGYDLANEPDHPTFLGTGVKCWDDLAETTAVEIRKIDPDKPIIVEPRHGDPGELSRFRPLGSRTGWSLDRIVYSVHHYLPHTITHQGIPQSIGPYPPYGPVYPGMADGLFWDSLQMRKALEPVAEFQYKYRVPIYIGEFSCIRWAPQKSALKWLTDAIHIFEEHDWDWTYHAVNDYDGWSVEYSDSLEDYRYPVDTDRKALLLSYFALNEAPTTWVENRVSAVASDRLAFSCSPNPFNPKIVFTFNRKADFTGFATFKIYDAKGRLVGDLSGGLGHSTLLFDASFLASGVYLARLVAQQGVVQSKITLMR